ncbi:MAG: hypothetical protein JOY79_01195 [Acidobacteriaceae bacterium]|nr:hypothetical protein [Acidobacteriaceae bacterium]
MSFPHGVASDLFGNLFVTDDGGDPCIRKIDAFTRNVSKYADGPPFSSPVAMARDSRGNLYVSDFGVIMKIDGQNQTITVAVGDQTHICSFPPLQDGVPATSVSLCTAPSGIALDGAGNLYYSDPDNFVVRKVAVSTGLVYTVAGNGTAGFSGDGGPATSAQLASPGGLFVDTSGNLYIADTGNNRVRKVVLSGRD